MRIAIFSDIHGNLEALKEILRDIEKENIDEIICLGDVIGLGPESKECLDLIINNNIKLILGNHELCYLFGPEIDYGVTLDDKKNYEYIASTLTEVEKKFLEKCPLFIEFKYGNNKVKFMHFLIKDKNLKYPYHSLNLLTTLKDCLGDVVKKTNADYIFVGHEHTGFDYDFGSKLYGVGSSGCVKRNITSYTIIDFKTEITVLRKVITYNRDKLIKAIEEKDYPERNKIASKFFGIEL